jgi:ribosomal small subunit protein bTHX
MGKGDIKTRKGKISSGSNGKTRPVKKDKKTTTEEKTSSE